MADLSTTIDTHLAAYCEPDAERRAALVAKVWSPHYPGHTFRRTTAVDEHHGYARYGWALVAADGTVAVAGTDIATLDGDGRLVKVVGFFGELEAA